VTIKAVFLAIIDPVADHLVDACNAQLRLNREASTGPKPVITKEEILQHIFLVVRICAFRIESVREGLEDGPIKKTTYERITKVLVPNNAILLEALNTGLRKVVKVVFCFFSDSEGWFGAAGRIQNGSVWVFVFFLPF